MHSFRIMSHKNKVKYYCNKTILLILQLVWSAMKLNLLSLLRRIKNGVKSWTRVFMHLKRVEKEDSFNKGSFAFNWITTKAACWLPIKFSIVSSILKPSYWTRQTLKQFLELQNLSIYEFYAVMKCRSVDFEAPVLWMGRSGSRPLPNCRLPFETISLISLIHSLEPQA